MICAFVNQKGGVGKSTLSVHLADAIARRGRRVLLIDADPQMTVTRWAGLREASRFSVAGLAVPTLHKQIGPLAAGYDEVIIDGPPRVNDVAKSAILAADLVVIPVQPSPPDVWASASTVDLIREAQVFKEALRSVFVVNRKIARTALGRDVRDALAELALPVLSADISQRVAFAESFNCGATAHDLDERSAASCEIEAFVSELGTWYEENQHKRAHVSRATGR